MEKNCISIAKSVATKVSNIKATEVMAKYEYDDILNIIKDENGNIKMVGTNIFTVNKIISDSFEPIKIGISKNQALFEMENCKIVTRLLDGEFLKYSNTIPSSWETRIKVNKSSIQECFERIILISASSIEKEKKYPVKSYNFLCKPNW